MTDFKKIISKVKADTIEKKIEIVADVIGCHPRTIRRLYDGHRPKNVKVYENFFKNIVDILPK